MKLGDTPSCLRSQMQIKKNFTRNDNDRQNNKAAFHLLGVGRNFLLKNAKHIFQHINMTCPTENENQ